MVFLEDSTETRSGILIWTALTRIDSFCISKQRMLLTFISTRETKLKK